MYPRNAASPERIAVGQVVLIADGTIQTSGVVITVRGQGGAEATGGGTTAYGAEGTVYYTPTQAETNYTSFVVIASKASCFSASQTIITTASATAGKVVLSGETHTSAVIPTVTTTVTATNLTNAPTNGDLTATMKTSVTTAATAATPTAAAVTGAVGSVTGNVGGNVVGSVGSVIGGATAAELAKVPKSDGTATWNATALASINAEADTAISDAALATAAALAVVNSNVDSILVDTASIGITKNATFSNLEFLMVDATDHVTPETGLTVTGQRSIDGGAFAAISGSIAEVSNGIYQVDLLAADTNGDVITYRFSATGAADRFITIKTRA